MPLIGPQGWDGAGDSFLKFSISTGVIFDTLNASQILKLEGENFGIAKFAVLSAAGKTFRILLKYCSTMEEQFLQPVEDQL